MTRNPPFVRFANRHRAAAAVLSLLMGLVLIGNAVAVAGASDGDNEEMVLKPTCVASDDAYPIVIGSDEDTLIACPATVVAGVYADVEIAHQLIDGVFNAANPDIADALIADDAVVQTDFGVYLGPDGLLDYVAFVKRAYPEAAFDVTNVTLRGATVEIGWVMTAGRILFDPVELPLIVNVEMSGSTTITFDQAQATHLSISNGAVLTSAPSAEAT